jgi:hypothetical protein
MQRIHCQRGNSISQQKGMNANNKHRRRQDAEEGKRR